jgi:hypothetical protein
MITYTVATQCCVVVLISAPQPLEAPITQSDSLNLTAYSFIIKDIHFYILAAKNE